MDKEKMTVEEWTFDQIKQRGITLVFVSNKSGVEYSKLTNCKNVNRKLLADEYLAICDAIGIDSDGYTKYLQEAGYAKEEAPEG